MEALDVAYTVEREVPREGYRQVVAESQQFPPLIGQVIDQLRVLSVLPRQRLEGEKEAQETPGGIDTTRFEVSRLVQVLETLVTDNPVQQVEMTQSTRRNHARNTIALVCFEFLPSSYS